MGSKRYHRRYSSDDSRSPSREDRRKSKKHHHKDSHKYRRQRSYQSSYQTRRYEHSTHHKKHKRNKSRDRSRRRKYSRSRSERSDRSYRRYRSQSGSEYRPQSKASRSRSASGQHYRFEVGEYLDRRYKVKKLLGDGTFGRVVEAEKDGKLYAIKIIKAVKRYIESAKTQRKIIKQINNMDPHDKYGIVRYVESFNHYKNYCLVFRPLGRNLYDVIKSNNYKGFPIKMIRNFFRQILESIGFLHRIHYTHTDLKPENILLQKTAFRKQRYPSKNQEDCWIDLPLNDDIRIIDFGGATQDEDHHSKIINTRQYRSPEVILGCCQWTNISDVWSIGCIIAELFTGELYFGTHENIEHLKMMEKHNGGPLPRWMTERSEEFARCYVNGKLDWPRVSSGEESIQNVEDMETISNILKPHPLMLDLLSKCLEVDPHRRITCAQALKHSFFSES